MSKISNSKHLTESQENEIFQEYSYKTKRITDFAIENKVYRNIEFYSHIQVENWIMNNKKYAFSCLYDISFFLKKLNNSNNLYREHIDDFFMIARSLSTKKIDKKVKQDVIRFIIEDGFEIFEDSKSEQYVKNEMIRQLKWINGYLEREKDLTDLKKEFYKKIDDLKASI